MSIEMMDWEKADWKPVRPGVERKAFTGRSSSLAMHRLEPTQTPRPHAHPQEQIVVVMKGLMEFYIVGEEPVRLGPGGVLSIPANVEHSARVIGDEVVIALDIFTPPRPE